MKKKICLLSICVLLLAGCGKVSKLANGQDAVVSFKDKEKISVDDLYDNMKKDYALQALINMIDTYIYETEFADFVDDAKTYAQNYINSMIDNYGGEDAFVEALQQYGYSTIDAYQKNIYMSYLQNHGTEEYAKTLVTDKDIEKYYKNTAQGDVEISHILITADVTNDMSEDEAKEAQDTAKKKAESIIKELKESGDLAKSFEELAKKYSKDDATKDNGGALGKITYGDLSSDYDELLKAAYEIKDGELYGKVITTELGYHVIMKTKSYEKESLEDMKEDIIKILADDLLDNTSDISLKSLQYYREQYDLKIEDKDLKKQYDNYMTRLIASYNTNTNNKNSNE